MANVKLLDDSDTGWDESPPPFDNDVAEDPPKDSPPDFTSLFGAADFSDLIQKPRRGEAADYEKKIRSMMKAGFTGSMNAGLYPDAATFLKWGPRFAAAGGTFAAENKWAKSAVDLISSPDSSALLFAAVAIPFVAQLFRNHQPETEQIGQQIKKGWKEGRAERKARKNDPNYVRPEPKFSVTIPLIRKRIPIRFNMSLRLKFLRGGVMSQTVPPDTIMNEVFSDPNVLKAMHKAGFNVKPAE